MNILNKGLKTTSIKMMPTEIYFCFCNEDIVFRIEYFSCGFNETNHHQEGHGFDASLLRPSKCIQCCCCNCRYD